MEPWETEPLLLHFCGRNKKRGQSRPLAGQVYPRVSVIWEKMGFFICRGACFSVS